MPILATYNEDQPTEMELRLLRSLVLTSDLDEEEKEEMMLKIQGCTDYKKFEIIQYQLEVRQQSIHSIINPSQRDINNHLRKVQ